jgi:hypothetical protein
MQGQPNARAAAEKADVNFGIKKMEFAGSTEQLYWKLKSERWTEAQICAGYPSGLTMRKV